MVMEWKFVETEYLLRWLEAMVIVVPVAVDRVRTLEDAIVDPEATVIVVITDLVRIREAEEVIAIILVPIRVRTREIVDLLVVLLLAPVLVRTLVLVQHRDPTQIGHLDPFPDRLPNRNLLSRDFWNL